VQKLFEPFFGALACCHPPEFFLLWSTPLDGVPLPMVVFFSILVKSPLFAGPLPKCFVPLLLISSREGFQVPSPWTDFRFYSTRLSLSIPIFSFEMNLLADPSVIPLPIRSFFWASPSLSFSPQQFQFFFPVEKILNTLFPGVTPFLPNTLARPRPSCYLARFPQLTQGPSLGYIGETFT